MKKQKKGREEEGGKKGRKGGRDRVKQGRHLAIFLTKLVWEMIHIFVDKWLARGWSGLFQKSVSSLNGSHSCKITGFYETITYLCRIDV